MTISNIRCPQCGKDDKIQKVSAIVSGQTFEISGTTIESTYYTDKQGKTHYETYHAPYSGTQVSVLAQRLSPPHKPSTGFEWGVLFAIGIWGSILIPAVLLDFALSEAESVGQVLEALLCLLPIIGLLILGFVVYKSSHTRYNKHCAYVQEIEIPRWQNAMERWNQLYYCFRDDGVFIPTDGQFIPIGQMTEYIYQS